MRKITIGIIAFAVSGGIASAQQASHNPAVKDPAPMSTAAPAKGSNSFTEAQAIARMAKAGYPGVTNLVKNEQGQWVGNATKGTTPVTVMLDYKGNVTTR